MATFGEVLNWVDYTYRERTTFRNSIVNTRKVAGITDSSKKTEDGVKEILAAREAEIARLKAQIDGTTVPGGGGTVVDPSGFKDRTLGDPKIFRQKPSFEENFPTLAPENKFLELYKMWSAYPTHYWSTDKSGTYDPNKISVIDTPDGDRVMQMRLVPASRSWDGKNPSGCCPQARWGSQGDGRTKGERIMGRFRLAQTGPGGHLVPLGWPPSDKNWPEHGEPDYVEIDTDGDPKVGGFLHVQNGGTRGEGQVVVSSNVSARNWFTVTFERVPGEFMKWYVNDQLLKVILPPGRQPAEGQRDITKVLNSPYDIPREYLRWPLQFETKGRNQQGDVLVHVDWWSIQELA